MYKQVNKQKQKLMLNKKNKKTKTSKQAQTKKQTAKQKKKLKKRKNEWNKQNRKRKTVRTWPVVFHQMISLVSQVLSLITWLLDADAEMDFYLSLITTRGQNTRFGVSLEREQMIAALPLSNELKALLFCWTLGSCRFAYWAKKKKKDTQTPQLEKYRDIRRIGKFRKRVPTFLD